MIPAGSLDRRIVIEQNTPTRDTYGAEVEGWTVLDEVWAGKRDISAREFFQAGTVSEATTAFRIRFREGITSGMRVLYGGDTYDIQAVVEVPNTRREALDLICKALRV